MDPNNESKRLPYSMSKADFIKLLHPLAPHKVIGRINLIIIDNRKNYAESKDKTDRQITRTKFLEKIEMVEYFDTYGWPNNIRP